MEALSAAFTLPRTQLYSDSQALAKGFVIASYGTIMQSKSGNTVRRLQIPTSADDIYVYKSIDGGNNYSEVGILALKGDLPKYPIALINHEIADWDAISKPGWYSGNNKAKNGPSGLSDYDWLNVTVFASNGNTDFLTLQGMLGNKVYYRKTTAKNTWSEWQIYTLGS